MGPSPVACPNRNSGQLSLSASTFHFGASVLTCHTAASLMLASGAPTKVVSELLGHSSPTITLSISTHVIPGMAEDADAALSASLLR